ncbi:MAG: 4Fe-4S dicluster domain-containing protein [Deltaproteobacteria bacterium]|nr:MAG: 4Fe-4S dicluster domain-containing protein [Deltaproteobacteria bacterium]
MSENVNKPKGKVYWRSFDELANTAEFRDEASREFPANADVFEFDPISRRKFLGVMGASMAMAGLGASGCRKPAQHILPYNRRPEDLVPGVPSYFATTMWVAGSVEGLLVKSQDGRPIKVEGNPSHPISRGRTSMHAQAAVLDVYDNNRSREPRNGNSAVSWSRVESALDELAGSLAGQGGRGLALLVEGRPSPTERALLAEVARRYPQATLYTHDPGQGPNRDAGLRLAGLARHSVHADLGEARIVVALDSNFMVEGPNPVANARQFADGRRLEDQARSGMNRLYAIEPTFTVTGANADNRLQLPASQIGDFVAMVAQRVFAGGASTPPGAQGALSALSPRELGERAGAFADAVAEDLLAHRGTSALLVGDRQPAWVHGLVHLVNAALGNDGRTVRYLPEPDRPESLGIEELVAQIRNGNVSTLVILDANPVYTAPADLEFAAQLDAVETTIHLGYHVDETARRCDWHIPRSHDLECWGDLRAADGTVGIQQPLIDPLFRSLSPIELLARLLGRSAGGRDLVRDTWNRRAAAAVDFESTWREWLHEGVVARGANPGRPTFSWRDLEAAIRNHEALPAPTDSALEVVFALDPSVWDGRYANNAWLQELPDPITKVVWDNAALVGPGTARRLNLNMNTATIRGFENATVVEVSVDGRSLTAPVFVVPGIADNVIVLPLGYGRELEADVAGEDVGFNAGRLLTTAGWFAAGATVTRTRANYRLATTQNHHSLTDDMGNYRPFIRERDLEAYRENPTFVQDYEELPAYKLNSLWEEPNPRDGQQWGMAIDLTSCIGCSACTIACQAENNIPVVGKERVMMGREMAWIRLDRYFSIDWDSDDTWAEPEVVTQPVACMHCETAPCEQVCPVAATVHSPEGLNDMVYNRCIGTRYCANNCPYKVRRFNFFNYSKENDERNPLYEMQKNPDVTVRFRGVMEKCTYCVQRINREKIHAKVNTPTGVVTDGAIVTACEQACPTNAIVFGDINDPTSRVSRLKRMDRDYALLSYLNIHPRTSYLAQIRNPHPNL